MRVRLPGGGPFTHILDAALVLTMLTLVGDLVARALAFGSQSGTVPRDS
jgi:hypothetical protein